jgi:hypothetical protein
VSSQGNARQAPQCALCDPRHVGVGRLLPVAGLLDEVVAGHALTLDEAVSFAEGRVRTGRRLTDASLAIFGPIWRGFARYASRASGVDLLVDVDKALVLRFLDATTSSGRQPTVSTKHQRRAALRFLFTVLRDAGLIAGDPTLDVHLPPRSPREFRALTTDEVERCRAASQASLVATREPAIWALAEIGATGAEVGEATPWGVTAGTVLLIGGGNTNPRQAALTPWGHRAVRRRLVAVDEHRWLVSADKSISAHSRRTSALEGLRRTMRRAGVAGADIEPRSVTAWQDNRSSPALAASRTWPSASVERASTVSPSSSRTTGRWAEWAAPRSV